MPPAQGANRYRITELAMWADAKFRSLSKPEPNAQTIWQFLLTGPFTIAIPGLVVCKPAMIASYYDWDTTKALGEAFGKAFSELTEKGMVKVDIEAGLMWCPGAAKPNRSAKPASPNVVVGWPKHLVEVPECALKHEALRELRTFVEALGEAFGKAFSKAFGEAYPQPYPHPYPNQEQEQEQEQEKVNSLSLATASDLGESPASKPKTLPPKANTNKPKKPKRKPTPKPPPSDTALKAAAFLRDQILTKAPNCAASRLTPTGLEDWARKLDALEALSDGHSWAAIKGSIVWLHSEENTFVVQSAAALAKKWDSIQANQKRSPVTGLAKSEDRYDRADRIRKNGGQS